MNNIPTIFPLKTHQKSKSSERRPLIRDYNASERYKSQTGATASTIAAALTTERVSLEEEIKKLQSKLDSLSLENERLQTEMNSLKFGLNRFIGSDVDMNYYTGMSARHFLAFFAFLDAGGICSRLRYWGSNNSRIQYPEVEKKGQKRLLEPRDELFLTLVRLRVNIPEKVLADNYKISVAEVSRIFVTWLYACPKGTKYHDLFIYIKFHISMLRLVYICWIRIYLQQDLNTHIKIRTGVHQL